MPAASFLETQAMPHAASIYEPRRQAIPDRQNAIPKVFSSLNASHRSVCTARHHGTFPRESQLVLRNSESL